MSIEEKNKTEKENSWLKDSVSEKEFNNIQENTRRMAYEEMEKAINNCVYLSNNHYSLGGYKLHKGICSAKGSICSKVIYDGKCPTLIELIKVESEEE